MAIIYTYPTVTPTADDLVLGTDVNQADKPTKNFTIQSIVDIVSGGASGLGALIKINSSAKDPATNINQSASDFLNISGTGTATFNSFSDGTLQITGGNLTTTGDGTFADIIGTLLTVAQPNVTSLGIQVSGIVVNSDWNNLTGSYGVTGTAVVTDLSAVGYVKNNFQIASTEAIIDYIGTNPPGAESLAATLLVGNTTGATKIEVDNTGGGIDFIDDAKLRLGTGDDFEMYHANADNKTYLKEAGANDLEIWSNKVAIKNAAGNEAILTATENAGVELYYDNVKKFETLIGGAKVTGAFEATGSGTFVNVLNTGYYQDSTNSKGTNGQILSSSGNGTTTTWITQTPIYNWIIQADNVPGGGTPNPTYTVASGDTIDFEGVGNISTVWDQANKKLQINSSNPGGTGTQFQVTYWGAGNTLTGDSGFTFDGGGTGKVTVGATLEAGTLTDGTFTGSSGTYTGGVSITSTTFVGALTGNADTATALAAPGTIELSSGSGATEGVASNAVTYTSGGNVTLTTTLADTTVTGKTLTNLSTATAQTIVAGDTILEALGYLQATITGLPSGLDYIGAWDASGGGGGSPDLTQGSTHIPGNYYVVSVAGTAYPNGGTNPPSDWAVGDWVIRGDNTLPAAERWQKIDNTSIIDGTGTANKIAKWTGTQTLGTGLIEDDGTTVTIGNSGDLHVEGDLDVDLTSNFDGVATFQVKTNMKQGIEVNGAAGTAGQVLTSGAGSAAVMSWTNPSSWGYVESVTGSTGITVGGTAVDPTVAITYAGASNAILSATLQNTIDTAADYIWFSDADTGSGKESKTLIQNLHFDQYTKWVLTGDTGTQDIESGNTVDIAGGTYITTAASATDTLTVTHDATTRSDTTSSDAPAFGATFEAVSSVTTNGTGHLTAIDVATVTIPANPVFVGPANGTTNGVAGIVPAPGQATYNGGYFLRQDATWAIPPDLKGVETINTTAPIGGGGTATTVTITHDTSGVAAGTYDSVTVDTKGHVTAGTNPGGSGGGIFSGDQAITAATGAPGNLAFTLTRATTGTLIFDVWLTSETSTATSVAKKYVVAHSYDTAPVYNKIIDTGPDGSNDFTVTFANSNTGATGTSVTCTIKAENIDQNIGYTVQVGHDSTNTLTFLAAS